MYPLSAIPSGTVATGEGMLQDTTKQRGAFVEVKGWGDVLEGASRREYYTYSSRFDPKLISPGELFLDLYP